MRKAGRILFILIIILTIIFRIFYLISPVDRENGEVIQLSIEPGSSASRIAKKLYNHQLIKSKTLFNIIISLKGLGNSLQAGLYEFKPDFDMLDIISTLVEGKVATFRVTIPEGFTVEEIVDRMAVLTSYSREEYLKVADRDFDKPYLEEADKYTKYKVEGFLYPDTYIIPKEYKPTQIFEVMLSEFEKRWQKDIEDNLKNMKGQHRDLSYLTPYQVITIASLIEEESKLDDEKPLIAAVIYNRLERNMLIQIDACIQYVMPDRKKRVLYSDLEIDSPYNTYLYSGLPPGPICSPGDSSIKAALYPADTEHLFYFALEDGSHVFSNSYREHLSQQQKMSDRR